MASPPPAKAQPESPPPSTPPPTPPPSSGPAPPPITLYKGPHIQRPAVSYLTWFIFTAAGLATCELLWNHLVWPPWKRDAELVHPVTRRAIALTGGGLLLLVGGMFKTSSSKNITRMVMTQQNGRPWVTITTSTTSLLPRHLGMSVPWGRAPKWIRVEPRVGGEFSVPLEEITRTRGAASSYGYASVKMERFQRGTLILDIGNVVYILDASGAVVPVRPEGRRERWAMRNLLRWFNWKVIRGSPTDPPVFWSRRAFDEMIPLGRERAP